MQSFFYLQLEKSTAHRKCRDDLAFLALKNAADLKELFTIAFDVENKIHYKACWVLELVLMEKLELINPFLEHFIAVLPKYEHDGAIRSISKIVMMIAQSKVMFLNKKQQKDLIEICFLWLSNSTKVANKAYSAYALKNFGKKNTEILPLLYEILEQDYSKFSAAYQAAAREIIRKR